MTAPTISVIIPTHNRAHLLPRAIDSVLVQLHAPDEIILVDDGSTDDTPAILAAYEARHKRMSVITLPSNRGAPVARNTGAHAASGDLLAFLDSDDSWQPEKLALQVPLLGRNPGSPAAFTGFRFVHPDGRDRRSHPPTLVTASDLYPRNVLGGTSSALIRRDAFMRSGGFLPDMPSCQDWELWLRLAQFGPLVALPNPLVDYHFDAQSRITRNRKAMEAGHARMFEIIARQIPSPVERRRVEGLHALRMAEILGRQYRNPRAALAKIGAALRLDPRPSTALLATRNLAGLAFAAIRS